MRLGIIAGAIGKDGAQWQAGRMGEFLTFSVSTSNGKNKDGTYKPSTYINCTMQDTNYARTVQQYLTQGAGVTVTGQISARAWIDKEGKPQAGMQLSVDKVELVGGSRSREPEEPTGSAFNAPAPGDGDLKGDDVPF